MNRSVSGHYDTTATGGEKVRAFVPFPLPPDPPLDLSGNRRRLLERSTLALGRLDSVSTLLPDPHCKSPTLLSCPFHPHHLPPEHRVAKENLKARLAKGDPEKPESN